MLSVFLVGACSIVLDVDDDAPVRCALLDGHDPCPDGLRCRDGLCVTDGIDPMTRQDAGPNCVPAAETCNDRDDDCDGFTDEDAEFDSDKDGFKECESNGQLRDCRDDLADVFPGADEACDRIDNDCDSVFDENPSALCSSPEECINGVCRALDCRDVPCSDSSQFCDTSLTPPECVPLPTGCNPPCVSGERCNGTTNVCELLSSIGEDCSGDADCAEGICFEKVALGLGSLGGVCGKACCSSGDCDLDQTCWVSQTGARSCLPHSVLGRLPGSKTAGAPCTMGDECASGACSQAFGCIEACALDVDCTSDSSHRCRRVKDDAEDLDKFVCQAPTGTVAFAGPCQMGGSDACISGACVDVADYIAQRGLPAPPDGTFRCTQSCSTGTTCPDANVGSFTFDTFCALVESTNLGQALQVCVPYEEGQGSAATGALCQTDDDCRDRGCECPRTGVCDQKSCVDTCCNDQICDFAGTGRRCRPLLRAPFWEMRCMD